MVGNRAHLNNVQRDGTTRLISKLDVPFQVHVEKFKDEVELLVRMNDLE